MPDVSRATVWRVVQQCGHGNCERRHLVETKKPRCRRFAHTSATSLQEDLILANTKAHVVVFSGTYGYFCLKHVTASEEPPHERGNRGGGSMEPDVEVKCNIFGTSSTLRRLTRIHALHRRGALGSATRRGGVHPAGAFCSSSMAHAPPPARNHSAVVY